MATDPYFIELLMKMTNKNATLGRYNKRDTTVTINNVMVSLFSLMAAPWR